MLERFYDGQSGPEIRYELNTLGSNLEGTTTAAQVSADAAAASASYVAGYAATALSIETAKQGLRDITKIDLSDCVTHEDMRTKVKAAYYAIVSAAPLSVIKAFSEVIK